jgi:hypothetical protein
MGWTMDGPWGYVLVESRHLRRSKKVLRTEYVAMCCPLVAKPCIHCACHGMGQSKFEWVESVAEHWTA